MGLEQNNEQHYREVVDKFHDPFADYQMTTRDYVLRPSTVGAAVTITLPPVAEAKGRFYSIVARTITGVFYVTVQDNDDSEDWEGDFVLSAAGQAQLLYSDGLKWMLRTFDGITVGSFNDAIVFETAMTPGGWDVGVLLRHGSMSVPIDYGIVLANDLVLLETSVEAIATGQWVIGQVNQLSSSGTSTGYFLGGYNYILVNHDVGAAFSLYTEVDITATAALSGNVSGLYSEMVVAAGAVVTGAGKISGLLIEMNVVATATVAQPIHGIEVDMRDIKVATAGEKIGIKVTMAGGTGFIDYGMQFSNCFNNATAIINFDLTQGNTACVMLAEAGAHTITNLIQTTGVVTNLLALPAGGTAPVVAAATGAGVAAEGSIAITIGGVTKYLQYFAATA